MLEGGFGAHCDPERRPSPLSLSRPRTHQCHSRDRDSACVGCSSIAPTTAAARSRSAATAGLMMSPFPILRIASHRTPRGIGKASPRGVLNHAEYVASLNIEEIVRFSVSSRALSFSNVIYKNGANMVRASASETRFPRPAITGFQRKCGTFRPAFPERRRQRRRRDRVLP